MESKPPRPRRAACWIRRSLLALLLLLVAGALIVYYGVPAWLASDSGREYVAKALEDSTGVAISIDSLHADWTGGITAAGVRSLRQDGSEAASLNLSTDIGLWPLLTDRLHPISAHVTGRVRMVLRNDGSMEVLSLRAKEPDSLTIGSSGTALERPLQLTMEAISLRVFHEATGRTIDVNPFNANVNLPPGAPPTLSMRGNVQFEKRTGAFDATATLLNLFSASGQVQPEATQLNLNATVQDIPTELVDALLNLQGMLTATVGQKMRATFLADQFSSNTGSLTADISTPQGSLQAKVKGRNKGLLITQNQPMTAELAVTHELRQKLLSCIHPLLADVRTTEQPIRAVVRKATIPTDGDITKLDAELTITVGKVELDAGSLTLSVLRAFGSGQEIVPGEIEPIEVKINKGIVTYDRFSVHIRQFTLNYQGRVDLVNKTVDLRTEIPLAGLSHSFRELRGFADDLSVPLITRGSIDKPVTEAKLDAVADQVLKSQLGNLLRDLLPMELQPPGSSR